MLVVAFLLGCAATAFAENQSDLVREMTNAGPGLLLQEIYASNHLNVKDDDEEDDPRPVDLAWSLGYAYIRTPSVGISTTADDAHLFLAGLDWHPLSAVDFSWRGMGDYLPEENLGQGAFTFRVGYTFPFKYDMGSNEEDEDSYDESYNPNDARSYYAHLEKSSQKKQIDPRKIFPHMEAAANLFLSHSINSTNAGIDGDGIGPEFVFAPDEKTQLKVAATFYFYDADVNSFVSNFYNGLSNRQLPMSLSGMAGITAPLLCFPSMSFDESITTALNAEWMMEILLNEAEYAVSTQPMTFGVGPVFSRSFSFLGSDRWRVSLGADLTISMSGAAFAGGLGVAYSL